MDLEPFVRVGFVFAKLVSYFRMKYFSSTAWHASQTSQPQVLQDFLGGHLGQEFKPIDFDCCPTFEMKFRIGVMQLFDNPTIPIVAELMMQGRRRCAFRCNRYRPLLGRGAKFARRSWRNPLGRVDRSGKHRTDSDRRRRWSDLGAY